MLPNFPLTLRLVQELVKGSQQLRRFLGYAKSRGLSRCNCSQDFDLSGILAECNQCIRNIEDRHFRFSFDQHSGQIV